MNLEVVKLEVEELRKELVRVVTKKHGNFNDPEVVKLSTKLDELIVKIQKETGQEL